MREAISEIITSYREYTGASIIVPLTIVSIFVIALFNNFIYEKNDKRRRINPTVFLLSIWSMISYCVTLTLKWFREYENHIDEEPDEEFATNKKTVLSKWVSRISIYLAIIVLCTMSGRFVFYKSYLENSIYLSGSIIKIIISAVITAVCVLLYFIIAIKLFDEKSDRFTFILTTLLLNVFSVYSEKSVEINLILNPLGVGSTIIHLILPILLIILLYKFPEAVYLNNKNTVSTAENDLNVINEDKYDNDDIENSEDYEEEWDMKKHKILNMRNMAIAFILLIIAFALVVFILNSKINSLYNATIALEKAAREKAAVYTYVSEENENVSLQIIVAGDGLITVIGGGSYEDGVEFMEYLKQYGTSVDKWYVDSADGSDTGVYEYCRNNGIVINSLYSVDGVKKID